MMVYKKRSERHTNVVTVSGESSLLKMQEYDIRDDYEKGE